MKTTIRGRLVAKQSGVYTNYVFQNLNEPEDSELHYIMVTQCPNWHNTDFPDMYETGFVTYEFVRAGEKYKDRDTGIEGEFKYTANYFINFIKDQMKDNIKEFNF